MPAERERSRDSGARLEVDEVFDFGLFRGRPVRVRTKNGTRYAAQFRTILDSWTESKPTLWLSDWSLDHYVTLDTVIELEASWEDLSPGGSAPNGARAA